MSVRPPLAFLVVAAVATLGTGCAVDPATRLRMAEKEQQRLSRELEETNQSLQAITSYAEQLRDPGKAGRSFLLYWSPASLEQLASQVLPLRMPARNFHRQLEGEVVVERLSGVRFGPMNRLTCQVQMRGENIRYTGKVPKAYAGEVRRFQQGVAAGVVADMEVDLSLSEGRLVARARALQTKLRANSSSTGEGMLRDQMNDRALRTPFTFDLTLEGRNVAPQRMVLTANHLVVMYPP
jgi:hypothetical protein